MHRYDGTATPVPDFDASWYIQRYTDVTAARKDPYLHYIHYGMAEGRAPRPETEIIENSGLFDPNHYLVCSPDVRESGMDPLTHFCSFGCREGRRPNAYFDPAWYAATYLTQKATPSLELTNYVLQGEALDRQPVAYFETGWYRQTYDIPASKSPLLHFLENRRTQKFRPDFSFRRRIFHAAIRRAYWRQQGSVRIFSA